MLSVNLKQCSPFFYALDVNGVYMINDELQTISNHAQKEVVHLIDFTQTFSDLVPVGSKLNEALKEQDSVHNVHVDKMQTTYFGSFLSLLFYF